MLTDIERTEAIKIALAAGADDDLSAIDDQLCRAFPRITTEELVAIWREAGERQLAEANQLEDYGRRHAL